MCSTGPVICQNLKHGCPSRQLSMREHIEVLRAKACIVQVADRFGMEWKLFYDNKVKRVALLVSRMDHCLYDILIRHRAGPSRALCPLPVSHCHKQLSCTFQIM